MMNDGLVALGFTLYLCIIVLEGRAVESVITNLFIRV